MLSQDEESLPPALSGRLAVLLVVLITFIGVDLAEDARAGGSAGHIAMELVIMLLALTGAVALILHLVQVRRRARVLHARLRQAESEVERFRAESREHLRGLAVAVDRQLSRWSLSPAEKGVGLLLLQGLSHKEIADARATSERTVRQQALAVYRKAGVSGRAELAAFFLKGLPVLPEVENDMDRGA